MWAQVQCLKWGSLWRLSTCDFRCRVWECSHPGDCGCVETNTESGREGKLWRSQQMYRLWEVVSHWRLRTCDPNYRVWEGGQHGTCGSVTTGAESGKWHHTGDCRHGTPGEGSGRESSWRMLTCDQRYRILRVGKTWRLWTCDPRYRVGKMGSPWWLFHVTPGTVSVEGCHPGHCGCATPGTGSDMGSPWRLRPCDWTTSAIYIEP